MITSLLRQPFHQDEKFTESHENKNSNVDADLLVLQKDKKMDQHQLKKVIDYHGPVLKEGEIPIKQRPPFDFLSTWRNNISGAIIGVVGTEAIKQLENKREHNVRIYLNGSIIPEGITQWLNQLDQIMRQ